MDAPPKSPRSRRKAPAAPESLPFEAALARLEEIVAKLESGDLGLDESLALFEEGVRLSRTCQGKLADVERKVELVLREPDGTIRTAPLDAPPVDDDEADEDGDDDDDDDDDGDEGGRAPF